MYPPIAIGTLITTLQPNVKLRGEWNDNGWLSKKPGVSGKILNYHDSHGLYYDVEHEDGTIGFYDPSEIEVRSL